jgi:hypothetical protein
MDAQTELTRKIIGAAMEVIALGPSSKHLKSPAQIFFSLHSPARRSSEAVVEIVVDHDLFPDP